MGPEDHNSTDGFGKTHIPLRRGTAARSEGEAAQGDVDGVNQDVGEEPQGDVDGVNQNVGEEPQGDVGGVNQDVGEEPREHPPPRERFAFPPPLRASSQLRTRDRIDLCGLIQSR